MPGVLQSLGSQRVGHDLAAEQQQQKLVCLLSSVVKVFLQKKTPLLVEVIPYHINKSFRPDCLSETLSYVDTNHCQGHRLLKALWF